MKVIETKTGYKCLIVVRKINYVGCVPHKEPNGNTSWREVFVELGCGMERAYSRPDTEKEANADVDYIRKEIEELG